MVEPHIVHGRPFGVKGGVRHPSPNLIQAPILRRFERAVVSPIHAQFPLEFSSTQGARQAVLAGAILAPAKALINSEIGRIGGTSDSGDQKYMLLRGGER